MTEFGNQEVKEWFEKAESDFDDARYLLADDRGNSAAFFLHQAAEKALKALQIKERGEYDYSHDLIELSSEKLRDEFFDLFKELNPVYTGTRYPDIAGEIENLGDLEERVGELLEWIEKQLKE